MKALRVQCSESESSGFDLGSPT
uniref:Uncharacterized protein n=1 Tax=Arundo donax TaxID=35708 RepID=A0A0A8YG45_ARUDO